MIIMDGGESALDVLSRAATMLQENQSGITCAEDTSKQAVKQLPTTKWKKERRSRAEYSRKSDPKIPDEFTQQFAFDVQEPLNSAGDAPLDMSVRQRGDPPSYAQTISNLGYRLNYRAPVVAPVAVQREDVPTGISMCDPIIDEHFRRSLGKDYVKIFSNNNVQSSKEAPAMKTVPKVIMEMMDDGQGLSVDEHFAKALGDTWVKLNKKGNEIGNDSSDKSALMSV